MALIVGTNLFVWFIVYLCTNLKDLPAPYKPVEMEPDVTLAKFKALYPVSPYQIMDEEMVIADKVSSTDCTGSIYHSLHIEDETAGLEVKTGKTSLYNDCKEGRTICIKPKYLIFGTYGGSLRSEAVSNEDKYETAYIDVRALSGRIICRGAFGGQVVPMELAQKSLIGDANVSRLVKLESAIYAGSKDGIATWATKADPADDTTAGYGEQNFKVDGKEVVMGKGGYASFADVAVGMETGQKCNLTGIFTKFNKTFQLTLLGLEGVEKLWQVTLINKMSLCGIIYEIL